MRVISGKYRSLVLAEFKGEEIRPTADRVKESLFNILSSRVAGAVVLDLFCGSGSLGIECLSRGANKVVFNDISKDSLAVLKKNLAKLKGENNYGISAMDFKSFLGAAKEKYDLIFLDPPYRLEAGAEALELIAEKGLLSRGGTAVLERDKPFGGCIEGLKMYDERKYGITYLSFFCNDTGEL